VHSSALRQTLNALRQAATASIVHSIQGSGTTRHHNHPPATPVTTISGLTFLLYLHLLGDDGRHLIMGVGVKDTLVMRSCRANAETISVRIRTLDLPASLVCGGLTWTMVSNYAGVQRGWCCPVLLGYTHSRVCREVTHVVLPRSHSHSHSHRSSISM
jgi:hypothetical protein